MREHSEASTGRLDCIQGRHYENDRAVVTESDDETRHSSLALSHVRADPSVDFSADPSVVCPAHNSEEQLLSPRHRLVLSHIHASDGSTRIIQLARTIAAHLTDQPAETVAPETLQRTLVEIHPYIKDLARNGHVKYCEDVGTVRLTRDV